VAADQASLGSRLSIWPVGAFIVRRRLGLLGGWEVDADGLVLTALLAGAEVGQGLRLGLRDSFQLDERLMPERLLGLVDDDLAVRHLRPNLC